MPIDLCRLLAEDFMKNSWECVKILVKRINTDFKPSRQPVSLFCFKKGKKVKTEFYGDHFFLRGSVEYSNPQLTIEEVQGII